MSKTIVKIDPNAFEHEIKKQGLKIWWLAEQLHVDRKTISRWISGKVKWAHKENLEAAAAILGCPPERLMAQSEVPLYATPEDQTSAAHFIYSEKLLKALTPSGKFELAEAVIRSLLSPNLPPSTLAHLYIELTNCCWQQNKLTEAEHYALCVLNISERENDPLLALRAQQHLVTIYSKSGHLTKAHELIDLCLSNPTIEADPEIHARILFEQSNALGHGGASIELVRDFRRRSREILEKSGQLTLMHEALEELGLAFFSLDGEDLEETDRACRRAQECCERIDFKQGLGFAKLVEAELNSRQGRHQHALKLFRTFYPAIQFGDKGLYEAMGAAIFRRAGNYEEALRIGQLGLRSNNEIFQAHCALELASTYSEMGLEETAHSHYLRAKNSYENAGALGRARRLKGFALFAMESCLSTSSAVMA